MNNLSLIIWPFLLSIIIGSSGMGMGLVGQPAYLKPLTTNTFTYDGQEFQNLANQVQDLKDVTESMRLKIKLNTFSVKDQLTDLKTFMAQTIGELLAEQHTIEGCSKYKHILVQELAKLKGEIVEEIRGAFVERHHNLSNHLSHVTHSVESKILPAVSSNIKSEIDDFKNSLQPHLNALWTDMKSEMNDWKHSILTNVTSEISKIQMHNNSLATSLEDGIDDFRDSLSTIAPQISSITNISQALQTTVDRKLNKLKNSLLQAKGSLADLSAKLDILYLPDSCVAALQNGGESGIYKLHLPSSGLKPFNAYCLKDPDNGPAWTVVQRRQDGSTNFYRSWKEYKNGFGDLSGEFFIGLDHLHALTSQSKPQELLIKLTDWTEATKYAKYSKFKIGDEASKYYLELGQYSGDAGSVLVSDRKFSTYDADNDRSSFSCAEKQKGAWWFGDCMRSHLNGEYLRGELTQNTDNLDKGGDWYEWRGSHNSFKYAHMAIRPSS